MNLLLLTSHAIAEYDDLRMFSDMPGVEVFSIGGAYDEVPFEGKRPPLDNVQPFPEFVELNHRWRGELTDKYGDPGPSIDWAKARLHPEIIDWADVIIVHHFPDHWIGGQWHNIKHKRVIWRTCGQSNPSLEQYMATYRRQGMQIVRYSPAERRYFEAQGAFAGEDAMIRFGKYPEDYGPWTGDGEYVANVTQNMVERGDAVGYSYWLAATEGLPTHPAGPGSEELRGGIGSLGWDQMRQYLARARAYLYTGTKPASYTLGLMEALLTGVPTISIGKTDFGWGDLFEGDELAPWKAADAQAARAWLKATLDVPPDQPRDNDVTPLQESEHIREQAIATFAIGYISSEWRRFLGDTTPWAAKVEPDRLVRR